MNPAAGGFQGRTVGLAGAIPQQARGVGSFATRHDNDPEVRGYLWFNSEIPGLYLDALSKIRKLDLGLINSQFFIKNNRS